MVNTEKKVGIKYESQKKSQKKLLGFGFNTRLSLLGGLKKRQKRRRRGEGGQKRGSLTLFSFFPSSSSSFFLHPVF